MSSYKTLMKMPQSKLAAKCIALEELLQRYYQFEEVHYDLQNKYQILQGKFEKLNKITNSQQLSQEKDTISYSSNRKLDSYLNCVEKIELCTVDEQEQTQKLIQELQNQNQKMQQELIQNKEEYLRLQSIFEQTQTELLRSASVKTASDSKYNSLDEKNYDSLQTYKNEIMRLNKIVSTLRVELCKYKTREFDEDWLKGQLIKYQKESQISSNNNNKSFNILDYVDN